MNKLLCSSYSHYVLAALSISILSGCSNLQQGVPLLTEDPVVVGSQIDEMPEHKEKVVPKRKVKSSRGVVCTRRGICFRADY